jgi:hypothetical protein
MTTLNQKLIYYERKMIACEHQNKKLKYFFYKVLYNKYRRKVEGSDHWNG